MLQGGLPLNQRSRIVGLAAVLLLLVVVLSACGAAPVAQNWPGLTVAGGSVYVISGSPQQVYILDAATGAQQRTFTPTGEHQGVLYWSPVAVGGDLAFVGFANSTTGSAALYAFDPATGQERWRAQAEEMILAAPAYAEGVVYFGDSSGKVYAVEAETGALLPGWPFQADQAIWGSPLPAGDRIYITSMDHRVYSLDAESGQEVWDIELGGAVAVPAVLDEAKEVLYVGAFDGRVYAIQVDSGELVEGFSFQADNWIWSEVLLADGRLYVTSLDGRLYALDPSTGQVVSPYPFDSGTLGEGSDVIRAAPVQAADNIVVATESGRVIAVQNAQVVPGWPWPSGVPESAIYTTPVVADGTIYVALRDGTVVTLDAEDGVQGWTFRSLASE
jgi:outer membrane protein assembly factor BamB